MPAHVFQIIGRTSVDIKDTWIVTALDTDKASKAKIHLLAELLDEYRVSYSAREKPGITFEEKSNVIRANNQLFEKIAKEDMHWQVRGQARFEQVLNQIEYHAQYIEIRREDIHDKRDR